MRGSGSLVRKLVSACQRGSNAAWQEAILGVQQTRFMSAVPARDEDTSNTHTRPAPPSDDHSKDGKVLHPELLNNQVLKTQYAVRGELYLRAEQLRREGKPIIFTNCKLWAMLDGQVGCV
jgi:glutamate--glyoxylate aminotransferase